MVGIIRSAAEEIMLPGIWSLAPLPALIGLLVFLFIALARGWIIPRSSHEREMALMKGRGDDWKETAKSLEKVNQEIRVQVTMLLEGQRISDRFYQAMTPPEAGDQRVGT